MRIFAVLGILGWTLLGANTPAQAEITSRREVRRGAILQSVAAEKHFSPRMQSAVAKTMELGELWLNSPSLPIAGSYSYGEWRHWGGGLLVAERSDGYHSLERVIRLSPRQRVMTATTSVKDGVGAFTSWQREVRLPFGLVLRSSRTQEVSEGSPAVTNHHQLELLVGDHSFTLKKSR